MYLRANYLKQLNVFIVLVVLFWLSPALAEDIAEDLERYTPAQLDSGSLTSVGSDSMDTLVALWVKEYSEHQPTVSIQVQSRGSASAAAALIEGVADLGPMARTMSTPELESFKIKYGFSPTQIRTAVAGVSVYVAKDNPLSKISLKDLDAIFSADPKRGSERQVKSWKDLNVAAASMGTLGIVPVGTLVDSSAYAYFRQRVLLQNDFRKDITLAADTSTVLDTIAANKAAIGFGMTGVQHPGVREVAVSLEVADEAYLPSEQNILSGKYPLSRYLNVYIVRDPGKDVDATTQDFLRFVLSQEGQEIVKKQGLMPLPIEVVREEKKKFL